ncbi:hypothetical protein ACMBCN_02075, partial [Candidatus Liberibacter asiaticus]|nr:hypothetical protein [Candidatus Liberibacter asiaticus]
MSCLPTSASFYSRWLDYPFFALLLIVHGTQLDHIYELFHLFFIKMLEPLSIHQKYLLSIVSNSTSP